MPSPIDSLRISLLRFPMIVLVVIIHAYDIQVAGQATPILDFIRNLFSQGVARIAVPAFFLMSGYLFFAGSALTAESYVSNLSSRLRTLFLPFVLWNLMSLAIFAAAQASPVTSVFFSGQKALIANYSPFDFVAAILGIGRQPIAYQFWFIRDLMVLVLFTPLICLMLKVVPRIFLISLGLCWLAEAWPEAGSEIEATLFFSLGSLAGMRGVSLFVLDHYGRWMVAIYVPLVLIDALLQATGSNAVLHHVGVAVGLGAAMFLTRAVAMRGTFRAPIVALAASSFLVYAEHEPLLNILRKLFVHATHPSQVGAIALYIALPLCLVVALVFTHRQRMNTLPAITLILCGGRK
jgi:peptidoglycan/LPS O-acetylase OafA/YrhL